MLFTFRPFEIPAVVLIEYQSVVDERGFFAESYRLQEFQAHRIPPFVQDNHSQSGRGVLRGLHYQLEPAVVGKLIHCVRGQIFDVAVDIRKGSPTFSKWVSIELSPEHRRMLYVPPGFAHGFCVLSDLADVVYKMTGYYSPDDDRSLLWSDPDIGVRWPIRDPILSVKDATAPRLRDAENNFTYR